MSTDARTPLGATPPSTGISVTLHLLGLPHLDTVRANSWCAYTQRTRDFATMMDGVVLYAGETNDADCEHVPLVTQAEQMNWWPDYQPQRDVFNSFDPNTPGWRAFNERAATAIRDRAEPGDVVAMTMGTSHRPAWDAIGRDDLVPVEPGCGYAGVWAPYRVYESWAWRHYLAGKAPTDDVRFYDEVIPRAYDIADFPEGTGTGGYFLYVGRLMGRKGPQIAADACKRLGAKLLVAGQGMASVEPGKIACQDGTTLTGDVEYVGVVGPEERAKLMGDAIALFAPTMYLEPFGGVSVEAQLTGTPAIVSDWGGLTENVIAGVTGYRCSVLAQFAGAGRAAPSLDRTFIRQHAQATWGMDAIRPRFVEYFERLETLRGAGWYQ